MPNIYLEWNLAKPNKIMAFIWSSLDREVTWSMFPQGKPIKLLVGSSSALVQSTSNMLEPARSFSQLSTSWLVQIMENDIEILNPNIIFFKSNES